MALSPNEAESELYLLSGGTGGDFRRHLRIVDTNTNTLIGSVEIDEDMYPLLEEAPVAVTVHPDGAFAYVAIDRIRFQGWNRVAVIDLETPKRLKTIILPDQGDNGPREIAFTPAGDKAYVAKKGPPSGIDIIRTADHVVTGSIGLGPAQMDAVVFHPDGTKAYVMNRGNAVGNVRMHVITTADDTYEGAVLIAGLPAGRANAHIEVDEPRSRAYLFNSTTSFAVFDIANDQHVSVHAISHGLARTGALSADGKLLFVLAPDLDDATVDDMIVFDAETLEEVGSVAVGRLPSTITVKKARPSAYVSAWIDDQVVIVGLRPVSLIEAMIEEVQNLVESGALPEEHGTGPLSVLSQALRSVIMDRPSASAQLGAFIVQIEGLVAGGVITTETGQPLIDAAMEAIALLDG